MSHRSQLLDRGLLYLFSYDVETSMDRQELGFVPGGLRITLFARPNLAVAYRKQGDLPKAQKALETLQQLNSAQAQKIRTAPGETKAGYRTSESSAQHP